ncbi:hypothetical protein PG987_001033 [Apiospora arundinis]
MVPQDAQDNWWDIRMPLPPGTPLSSKQKERDVRAHIGSGQLADPRAMWTCNIPEDEAADAKMAAIERIVRGVAAEIGLTHAWIRSKVHNYGYEYDKDGNRVPEFDKDGFCIGWKIVRKDNHLTVDFGHSANNVAVHGHIYVKADQEGIPTGLMDMGPDNSILTGTQDVTDLDGRRNS